MLSLCHVVRTQLPQVLLSEQRGASQHQGSCAVLFLFPVEHLGAGSGK